MAVGYPRDIGSAMAQFGSFRVSLSFLKLSLRPKSESCLGTRCSMRPLLRHRLPASLRCQVICFATRSCCSVSSARVQSGHKVICRQRQTNGDDDPAHHRLRHAPGGPDAAILRKHGFEVSMRWHEGKLTEASLFSTVGGSVIVRWGNTTQTFRTIPGETVIVRLESLS